MPIALWPVTGCCLKEPGSIFFPSFIRCLHTGTCFPRPSLHQSWTGTALSFSLYDRGSSPFILSVAFCWTCSTKSLSLLYWTQHSWTWCVTGAEQREGWPPLPCWQCCPMHPGRLLVTFTARTWCWLMVSLLSTRIPRAIFAKLLCWHLPGLCHSAWGYSSLEAGFRAFLCWSSGADIKTTERLTGTSLFPKERWI